MIRGLQISLTELPDQHKIPHEIKMSSEETVAADETISKLLKKQAIIPWTPELDGFMNNSFMRPKKDGGWRTILNLKRFNTYIDKIHFKMETLQNILDAITPNCFMASLDLQDAFHGLGVDPKFWKYLQFTWKGQVYTYVAMPFGLTSAPRHYTKLLKPVLAQLRKARIVIFIYLDDSWIRGMSFNSCLTAVKDSLTLMLRVGLLPHPEKSAPLPVQCIEFLGFVLDSILMQVSLTPHKTTRVIQMCVQAIERKSITIRELAQLIGKIVSCFPATPRGRHITGTSKDSRTTPCCMQLETSTQHALSTSDASSHFDGGFKHFQRHLHQSDVIPRPTRCSQTRARMDGVLISKDRLPKENLLLRSLSGQSTQKRSLQYSSGSNPFNTN